MDSKDLEKEYSKRIPSKLKTFFDEIYDLSDPEDFKQYHKIRDGLKDCIKHEKENPPQLTFYMGTETAKVFNDIFK